MRSWATFSPSGDIIQLVLAIYISGYRTGPYASKITTNILVLGSSVVGWAFLFKLNDTDFCGCSGGENPCLKIN